MLNVQGTDENKIAFNVEFYFSSQLISKGIYVCPHFRNVRTKLNEIRRSINDPAVIRRRGGSHSRNHVKIFSLGTNIFDFPIQKYRIYIFPISSSNGKFVFLQ